MEMPGTCSGRKGWTAADRPLGLVLAVLGFLPVREADATSNISAHPPAGGAP